MPIIKMKSLMLFAIFYTVHILWIPLSAGEATPKAAVLGASDIQTWKIAAYEGWQRTFDGGNPGIGSMVFSFSTSSGIKFSIMAANTTYWTADDRRLKRQVYYLLRGDEKFLIKPKSEEETKLLDILTEWKNGAPKKVEEATKQVQKLVENMKSRNALFRISG